MKRLMSVLLIITVILSVDLHFAAASCYAASTPTLSSSKISLDIGVKEKIKLQNAPGKVKWSSSNKSVAAVYNRRGRYGSTVTIRSLKHGSCIITASAGGKKYRCKVSVSKITIKPLSSSSVERLSSYKYDKKLAASGTKAFNTAAADFSFELLEQISSNGSGNKNVLVSPASVLTAMVMVENGAKGNTLKEMRTTLSGGISLKDFNAYLAGLNSRLGNSRKLIYQQANSLWIRRNSFKVNQSFLKKNKRYHNAQTFDAPFNSKTVKDVNNWVFNNSRNMINGIIDKLSPDDRMIAVNTTAFEGKWADSFGSPEKDSFTSANGTVRKVKMLSDTGNYRKISLDGGKGFAKFYDGEDNSHSIAFVGIVPPEGIAIEQYVSGISGKEWISAWKKSKYEYLSIKLPQFKYDYSASLKAPLSAMGIKDAFTAAADFSGISAEGKDFEVDDVLHKTHIELNRYGTKAAAATAVVMKASSMPMEKPEEVFLNRPFVYALVDAKTGIPLFVGIINTLK